MWIKFTKNYTGPLGMFYQGERKDLLDATAKQLLADKVCNKTCPPWEDNIDRKLVKQNQLLSKKANIESDLAAVNILLATAQEQAAKIPSLQKSKDSLEAQLEKIKKQLPAEKDKTDAKPNTEPAAGSKPDPKGNDNAEGQAAATGQSEQ